jgi:hypothetical protein
MFSDSDFLLLYGIYFAVLVSLICGYLFSKKYKIFFKNNLIVFLCYTFILFIPSFEKGIMKGGSSLFFIFYGWIFLLLHVVIFLITFLWRYFQKKV